MGGRGAKSGVSKGASGINVAGGMSPTPQQNKLMESMKRNILKIKDAIPNSLTFSQGDNGQINYSYQSKNLAVDSHVGKMVDPLKDKIYERTTTKSGKITPDGANIRNFPTNQDVYLGTRKQLLKQGWKIWDGT